MLFGLCWLAPGSLYATDEATAKLFVMKSLVK